MGAPAAQTARREGERLTVEEACALALSEEHLAPPRREQPDDRFVYWRP
jgi:hypothetical protein